jgi:Bromodomain
MDLNTIKKKLENGSIQSLEEFQRDLRLMFTNVILYYHADATRNTELSEMQDECFKLLEVRY